MNQAQLAGTVISILRESLPSLLAEISRKQQEQAPPIQHQRPTLPIRPQTPKRTDSGISAGSASSLEDLEVAAQCAASKPANPDEETIDEAHIRIGQQLAAQNQLDEIQRVQARNKNTPLKQILQFRERCPSTPDKRNSPCLESVSADTIPISSSNNQLAGDKKIVTRPVLNKLDAKFLAPRVSPLFKQYFKKMRGSDGKRIPKKHREMDEELFRFLIRPVLRRLLGINHMHATDMVGRYYRASMVVTKKRRANHVQSWRMHGTHKKLIYGGELPPGSVTPVPVITKPERKRARRRNQNKGAQKKLFVMQSNGLPQPMQVGMSSEEESQAQVEDETQAPTNKRPRVDAVPTPEGPKHGAVAGGKVCVQCQNPIDCTDKDSFGKRIRCNKCFDTYIRETVVPEHHGHIIKKREPTNKNKQTNAKKGPKKPCKCGSTSHSRTTHSSCPLNKKNKGTTSPTTVVTTNGAVTAPPATDGAVTAPPATDGAVTTTPAPEATTGAVAPTPTFNMGDNVNAMWSPGHWYLSHVCGVHDGMYDVYCPVDEQIKKNLRPCNLRPYSPSSNTRVMTRAQLVREKSQFFFPGDKVVPPSRWKVIGVLNETNMFKCERQTDAPDNVPKVDEFRVGYVMEKVEKITEELHERGPEL